MSLLLTAGLGLLGGALGAFGQANANKTNRRIAEEQNRLNYRMFQEQNQFNLDQWNRANEYNTPLAQRKRLEEAGINPYLALGNMSTGTASALTSASPSPAVGANVQNAFEPMGNALQGASSTLLQEKQIAIARDKANAEIEAIKAKTAGELSRNKYIDEREKAEISNTQANTAKTNADTNLSELNAKRLSEMLPFEKQALAKQIEESNARIDLDKAEKELRLDQLKMNEAQRQQILSTVAVNLQSITYMRQQGLVSEATAKKLYQEALNAEEQRVGIKFTNDFNKRNMDLLERQLHTNVVGAEHNASKAYYESKMADKELNYMDARELRNGLTQILGIIPRR